MDAALTPEGSSSHGEVGLDFQAVILAGGLGTRLRPITETIPKPMVEICGRPFLEHQLALVRANGLRRVLLLVAYLGEIIEDYFGDGSSLGMQISYSYEPVPLGTGGALKNAERCLDESFLLLNGDTYLPIAYDSLINDYRHHKTSALIVAYRGNEPCGTRNLSVNQDARVTAYRKRASGDMTHMDSGAIILDREVLAGIPLDRACSLEEEVFPRLIEAGRMRAWTSSEPFFDMGTPEGIRMLSKRLE